MKVTEEWQFDMLSVHTDIKEGKSDINNWNTNITVSSQPPLGG